MRSMIICSLALLPILAQAQVNQAGTGTASNVSVTLDAKVTKPNVFPPVVASAAASPDAPFHDDVEFHLDSNPVLTATRNSASLTAVFGSSSAEATAPRLVHVVGRTLPVARLANEENNAYVTVHLRVNDKGQPENLSIARSAGATIDKPTLAAVSQYRFLPATVDHIPVQADVTVEVMLKK